MPAWLQKEEDEELYKQLWRKHPRTRDTAY